jgi:hypothetical protein
LVALAIALLAAIAVAFGGTPGSVAGPGVPARLPDPEGGTKALRDELAAASTGYVEAKAKFDTSKRLEGELHAKMEETKRQLDELTQQVGVVAAMSYRTGRLGAMGLLLNSGSPDDFLQRATNVELIALHGDAVLHQLLQTQVQLTEQQDQLFAALADQSAQVAAMEKRKKDAERALLAAGGGRPTTGFVSSNSPAAKPAPRNADGTWPRESCTVNDPTTSGCLTPRTLHAYQQTKAAGFNHYVSCYRSGGGGEHPLGRACDWAASANGFAGVATGADKTYGDRLAAWYVENADRLAVMYVIWFKRIWMPGTGWRTYGSGSGDPASDHTNHVHLSVL